MLFIIDLRIWYNDKGWTPLHSAAKWNNTQIVELMLNAGLPSILSMGTVNRLNGFSYYLL